MTTTTTYAPAGVRVGLYAGKHNTALCDIGSFSEWIRALPESKRLVDSDWCGGMDYTTARDAIWRGDMAGVAASDALLDQFESVVPVSRSWRTFAAVAGGAPNVAAHLAGSPLSMRVRQRAFSQGAPLNVFVDIVSSYGVPAESLTRRGVAALALVRALGANRPVRVFAVAAMQHSEATSSQFIAVEIPAPVDLARAAFLLAHPAAARALAYEAGPRLAGFEANGSLGWAFRDHAKYLTKARTIWAHVCGVAAEDCLYLAPPHASDSAITNPVTWIKDKLMALGAAAGEEAA